MKTESQLMEIAANEFGSTPSVIRGKSRTRRACHAREAIAYIMHLHEYTHTEISKLVNRNASSVTYAIQRVKARRKADDKESTIYCQALRKACFHAGIQMPSN
jgi:chromosomal replication initiation ATPase DnaA